MFRLGCFSFEYIVGVVRCSCGMQISFIILVYILKILYIALLE